MAYNLTNVTGANNMVEIVKAVNDQSSGLLIMMLISTLFIVLLITYGKNNFKAAFLAGSFMMVVVCVPLFIIGWIPQSILIMPVVLLLISIMTYKFVD